MADLTLPGDLPGLLRRGSPVVFLAGGGTAAICARPIDYKGRVCWLTWWENGRHGASQPSHPSSFALDLTDPTGRVHAAWCVNEQVTTPSVEALVTPYISILMLAFSGVDMTDDEIATLRDLCLRLAGREQSDPNAAVSDGIAYDEASGVNAIGQDDPWLDEDFTAAEMAVLRKRLGGDDLIAAIEEVTDGE